MEEGGTGVEGERSGDSGREAGAVANAGGQCQCQRRGECWFGRADFGGGVCGAGGDFYCYGIGGCCKE